MLQLKNLKRVRLSQLVFSVSVITSLCLPSFMANAENLAAESAPGIVSAGGSITEIIFALGAEKSLVGVDSSSLYPSQASDFANVGYYRQLNVEGVMSVNPTLVIGLDTMGPSSVLSQLERLGLRIEIIPLERSVKGLTDMVERVGQLVGREPQAAQLNAKIEAQMRTIPKINDPYKKVLFLLSANQRGLMAAGSNTVPSLIFDLIELNNPTADLDGFKPISNETLLHINPDLILLPNHQRADRNIAEICELPSLRLWAMHKGCNIYFVDSLSYLGITPRLPSAASQLTDLVNN